MIRRWRRTAARAKRCFASAKTHAPFLACPEQAMNERAQIVWELLEQLLDTDAEEEQFHPFAFVCVPADGHQVGLHGELTLAIQRLF